MSLSVPWAVHCERDCAGQMTATQPTWAADERATARAPRPKPGPAAVLEQMKQVADERMAGRCVAASRSTVDDRVVTDLITHLESHLGEITGGSQGDESTPDRVQVVWFEPNSPFEGATTIATLGLSRYHLDQPSGTGLHQELLMHLRVADPPGNAAAVLFYVAAELISRGAGLLRGEVIGPRGSLFGRGNASALYAAAPVYLPDEFAVYEEPTRSIVLTWLVPITDGEADFVRAHGWAAFEAALFAVNPDLTDPDRHPVTDSRRASSRPG